MRRALAAAALLVATFGCSEKPLAQAARLQGVNELALVGQYIFSTSTDKDELRVLNLAPPNVQGRQFLPAPNPLEALSIPVVARPVTLARDLRYKDGSVELPATWPEGGLVTYADGATERKNAGQTVTVAGGLEDPGPYVYALAAGGVEISVVGARPELMRELKRLVAPAPVTAMTAFRRAVIDGDAVDESRLTYATWDGTRSLLIQVGLPDAEPLEALTQAQVAAQTRVIDSVPGEAISALLQLSRTRLVVATRANRGAGGRTYVLDLDTLEALPLDFPGPVRMLTTHAGLFATADGTFRVHRPAERIFGVLAEEACGNPACGGVVAVDTQTGQRALDATGVPMMTLSIGDALTMGLTIAPNVSLNMPGYGGRVAGPAPFDLLGVATTSAGSLVFFDALGLSQIDFDTALPEATLVGLEYPPTADAPNGSVRPYVATEGPLVKDDPATEQNESTLHLGDGAARTQTVYFVVQGAIPGLTDLPTSPADGLRFPLGAGWPALVQTKDFVVISSAAGVCGEARVTALQADGLTVDSVPAACSGRQSFTVRGGGADPWIVMGTVNGYMGRTGAGRTFTYIGDHFFRTRGTVLSEPAFQVDLGTDAEGGAPRDARWALEVSDRYAPYVATLGSDVGCSPSLPGAPILDVERQRLFVAYSSANGIVEISPASAYRGSVSRNVYCYR